jgi:hypothetical protein
MDRLGKQGRRRLDIGTSERSLFSSCNFTSSLSMLRDGKYVSLLLPQRIIDVEKVESMNLREYENMNEKNSFLIDDGVVED